MPIRQWVSWRKIAITLINPGVGQPSMSAIAWLRQLTPCRTGLDIRNASALSFQHVQGQQPGTDKRDAEEVLARRESARENTVHLPGFDREHSDLVNRDAGRAGFQKSRALVLSAIRRRLAHHAAYFPLRRLPGW
jgi:hypothetical protein